MNISLRKKIFIIFALANSLLLSVTLIYSYMINNAITEGYEVVECFFKHNFLFYCPGCGGSRSLFYLTKLDIIKSFIYYPPLPLSLLIIIDLDIRALISFIKNDSLPIKKFKPEILILIPIFIFLNFILRNFLLIVFGIDYIGDIL